MKYFVALIIAALSSQLACAQQLPMPETDKDTIGYKTVAEALAALRAKPGVEVTDQQGWTIAADQSTNTVWSFPQEGHPAFPSAVKRTITEHDGALFVTMNVLCQSTKAACDQLVREFSQLNDRLRASMAKKPN